ncbi:Gfo/Idh/MocA family oxidoreductase [Paenibacillus hemerocallicola]|uniref:Gfo/Idh/MocA family oxidoreductase n=1 Tax=Paenibacillus hemerocallicola TaxID=1172614 RepID=A0A5C4T760_9BACL|nr:Gfo/Idh/MocA family oxidoreductase [Paenibacillus hemerocallicola]TNJ64913.1 Gfo/Idh/MocA family oxidoreductase [Paenibacillus hemerocallicola]
MKKIAVAGAGARAHVLVKPLATQFREEVELVGVYDQNPSRARLLAEECGHVPVYASFDSMLQESGTELVLITTMDSTHDAFIIRALEAGLDVITEKPMTTDAVKCQAILDAEKRTGRNIKVAFNCRYMPYMMRVKELLDAGTIGDILSVDYNWYLDSNHGAQYFRRWHRHMSNSGGLLVHKSTHHFDLANWWLRDEPVEVSAFGERRFFGPTREERGFRCLNCSFASTCEFYFDIKQHPFNNDYFHKCETDDGYIRDRCVFGDDIDIYDTMSVHVRYRKGTVLNYSLVAHSPYKHWTATFNGTKGRIEAGEYYTGDRADEPTQQIRLFNRKGEKIVHEARKATGSHGGSDDRIRKMFVQNEPTDSLEQRAGSWEGALSMLIGAAANISIQEQRKVTIQELLNPNAITNHR